MTIKASEFVMIPGNHLVTVPEGSSVYPELIGVRGQLKASAPDARVQVLFEGSTGLIILPASHLTDYPSETEPDTERVLGPKRMGIYFGSETGNTEAVANTLHEKLKADHLVVTADICQCELEDLLHHDVLLLGVSTWDIGEIQSDWEAWLQKLELLDLRTKQIAIFGLGDAVGYPDTFVDGMGILWESLKNSGADLIGIWPSAGYEFDDSLGRCDSDHFLGLVIDEDNDSEKTSVRIDRWVEQLNLELQVTKAQTIDSEEGANV
ncbi:MAG: flavodoxin [Fuerstiella sp.]